MNSPCKVFIGCLLLVVCLLASGVVRAGESLDEMAERAINCGVSEETVELVRESVANDALAEGHGVALITPLLATCVEQLPVPPLESKLAEGMAKRVPAQLIVRALKKKLDGYRYARELLLTRSGTLLPEALFIVGDGLDKGVPEADFEAYVAAFGKEPQDVFVIGLDMVSLQGQVGFDPALTRRIIERAVRDDLLSPAWRYFVRIILTARKRGIDDAAIARAALGVLEEGGTASDVMESLGFTDRYLGEDTDEK